MSDSIEIAKRYFDIIPTLEFSSVSAVLNAGTESSMRKAYRPDALVWAMAHELEVLTAELEKRDAVVDKAWVLVRDNIHGGLHIKKCAHKLHKALNDLQEKEK